MQYWRYRGNVLGLTVLADDQEEALKKLGWAIEGIKNGTIPPDVLVSTDVIDANLRGIGAQKEES